MKLDKYVGHSTEKVTVELERGQIRRFAEVVGAASAIHYDPGAARKAGYADVVAPASMAATFGNHRELLSLLDLDQRLVLQSEQTIELRRPLQAGDVFKVQSTITDLSERDAGGNTSNGFVTIVDVGYDRKGTVLFSARRVYAVRGGFSKR